MGTASTMSIDGAAVLRRLGWSAPGGSCSKGDAVPHMHPDQIKSVSKDVGQIAEQMPQGVSRAQSTIDSASSAFSDSTVLQSLSTAFTTFSDQYKKLASQVDGFSMDLSTAATTWHKSDDVNADVFKNYGQGA
ncbi:MAG: hypothetical protein J2P17_08550 [Mycobacterium sp.]|nr:hypothetical protein [Mycobacterium sp.]